MSQQQTNATARLSVIASVTDTPVTPEARGWRLAAALAALGCATLPSTAPAQPAGFPNKPIRLIVGFAPGGPADIIARTIQPRMGEALGQTIVIENRAGAGGMIGTEAGARATPDGYTLLMGGASSLTFAPALYTKVAYDPVKDFAPISTVVITPYVVAINPRVPAKSVADLVRLGKGKPNFLSFGSSGSGAASHVGGELLALATGLSLLHVPYKGTGPALAGVIAGEIDMMVADLGPVIGGVKDGRLRVLGAMGSRRPSAAPDIPTLTEAGFKVPPFDGRFGVVGPSGLSADTIGRLNKAVLHTVRAPDVRQRFESLGYDPVGDTPEQYAKAIRDDLEVFTRLIRQAGIKPN
jgi:tripartite-type tricarboxylate transporter receptor subunit TctC